ncbi:MAG: hypothetical protein M1812_001544 [Candelaria pacifica]|nr:MAG: hypothetical protein M1812_001544 [Candelaria pacifica]
MPGNFLKRLLSRRGQASKPPETESIRSHNDFASGHHGEGQGTDSSFDNDSAKFAPGSTEFVTTPSPHTRPLICKPEPRDDCVSSRPRSHFNDSTVLCARASGGVEKAVTARDVYVRNLRKREMMAVRAAREPKHVQEWGFYLKGYSEVPLPGPTVLSSRSTRIANIVERVALKITRGQGRHNLSTPPDPPPRKSNFSYLSAPPSVAEAKRLATTIELVLQKPRKAQVESEQIVVNAKRAFKTSYASVSFVEWESEVVIAGYGYNQAFIPRNMSIGAHVILSSEVMVLADAKNDWRMKGNPLVCNAPCMRFYAGAPLITRNGHAVGVLAIFDPEPRAEFELSSRRKLQDFAKSLMSDFEDPLKDKRNLEQHVDHRIRRAPTKPPLNIPVFEKKDVPHRDTEPRTRTQRRIARNAAKDRSQPQQPKDYCDVERRVIEDTPPPSDHSFDDPPDVNNADLQAIVLSALDQVPAPSISHSKPSFSRRCSNRDRNRDSGRRTPPQTPPRPPSVAIARTRISRPSYEVPSERNLTIASPPYVDTDDERYSPTESHLAGSTVTSTPNAVSAAPAKQLDRPHLSPDTLKPVTEANFKLCLLTLEHDYDFIYLMRICSFGPPSLGGGQGSVTTRLLFSHGNLDPHLHLDPWLHLDALRSAGATTYKIPKQSSSYDPIVYSLGIIIPIIRDGYPDAATEVGMSKPSCEGIDSFSIDYCNCMGGVVLAAFGKQPGDVNDLSSDVVASVASITRAGYAFKDLVVGAY